MFFFRSKNVNVYIKKSISCACRYNAPENGFYILIYNKYHELDKHCYSYHRKGTDFTVFGFILLLGFVQLSSAYLNWWNSGRHKLKEILRRCDVVSFIYRAFDWHRLKQKINTIFRKVIKSKIQSCPKLLIFLLLLPVLCALLHLILVFLSCFDSFVQVSLQF